MQRSPPESGLVSMQMGTLNMNKAGISQDRAFSCMRHLSTLGVNILCLQECQNVALTSNSIHRLGWEPRVSKCMQAAIVLRGEQHHNIKFSSSHDRFVVVALCRPCVFIVSAYFPHSDREDAVEVQLNMLRET